MWNRPEVNKFKVDSMWWLLLRVDGVMYMVALVTAPSALNTPVAKNIPY